MDEILQVPAIFTKAETMAHKSLKLVFNTQENLTDEQVAKIMAQHEKLGWLTFLVSERKIEPEDLLKLPELPQEKTKKSQGQRLHAVLYLWHEKNGGKKDDFPLFYETQMEKLINQVKDKLN